MHTCRSFASLFLVVVLVGLAGCGGSDRLRHQSAEEAFTQGQSAYESGDYEKALRYFRAVFQYGRGNEWADDAQFYLGKTYSEQNKHLLAANEFKRFAQVYRNSQRVPEAEYLRAMAYFNLSPQYQLDQTDTRTAVSLFQLFMERYPQHERVSQAQAHIQTLRNKLARKRYTAGELYERREMWEAATQTYESVFDVYPDTPWADNALHSALRAYIEYADRSVLGKQDDRLEKAIEQYNRLAQLFPDSDLTKDAQSMYEEAQEKLARVREEQGRDGSLASDRSTRDGA